MWKGVPSHLHDFRVVTIMPILAKVAHQRLYDSRARGVAGGPTTPPSPPTVPLRAAPHLTHTAPEVSTHIGGWGQLYRGLHTTQVEQGVQVEALALSW